MITELTKLVDKKKIFAFRISIDDALQLEANECNIQDFKKMKSFKYLFKDLETNDKFIIVKVYKNSQSVYVSFKGTEIKLNNSWASMQNVISDIKEIIK